MKLFWILMGLLGLLLIYLITSSDSASFMGLGKSQFAQFGYMSIWLVLVASALLPGHGRHQWRETARNLAIWVGIFLVLMTGYVYRYDLQDVASRMTAGLVPGSPISGQSSDGRNTITLMRGSDEHFHAKAEINGVGVTFLVDTGATTTVLTFEDAKRAGIDPDRLGFHVSIQTANGQAFAARTRLADFQLGSINRHDFPVLVSQPGNLDTSLLGMDFMQSLWGFEVRGDRMILTN